LVPAKTARRRKNHADTSFALKKSTSPVNSNHIVMIEVPPLSRQKAMDFPRAIR
jgi:hypothetical protein